MFDPIVVMGKRRASIVGRINENAFNLSCVLSFESFKREKVVAEYKLVVENIIVRDSMGRVMA